MKPFLFSVLLLLFFVQANSQHLKKSKLVDTTVIDTSERQKEYENLVKGTSLEVTPSILIIDNTIPHPYYVGTAGNNTQLYADSSPITTILIFKLGQQFVYTSSNAKYIPVTFGDKHGYVARTAISKPRAYTESEYKALTFHSNYGTYNYIPANNANDISTLHPTIGNYSSGSSSSKTVHVNGYTRKDGTHVQSYNRRPPSPH